jgi:hypothetical protein
MIENMNEETAIEVNRELRRLHRLTQLMDEKAIVALMKNIIKRNS